MPNAQTSSFPQPERPRLRVGFVALTDCAPLVVAHMLEIGKRHGITLELCRQPSWASVRDKLLSGELDAAHALYGLAYGVQLGIGGPQADMAVLMTLSRNGQAVVASDRLSRALQSGLSLRDALATLGRKPVFAHTFPTGTHAMWLNYWLAAQNVHPLRDVECVVIPPQQMAEALAQGELDGFCAGEPWPAVAEAGQAGRTIACSSEIWPNHPEKALICRREFAALYPDTVRALICTMLEAGKWIELEDHRATASQWLAHPGYVGVASEQIVARLSGDYGGASLPHPPLSVRFFDDADNMAFNAPSPTEGLWFISQYHRWGILAANADAAAHTGQVWKQIAASVSQMEHYCAATARIGCRDAPILTKTERFMDGRIWHGENAPAYASDFEIRA